MRTFGELEAAVMDSLWARGEPTTVREVWTDLREQRELAYTTVLTVLDNLFKKGWLQRDRDGRAHRYWPMGTREEYSAGLMRQALQKSADPAEALIQFIGQMSSDEAAALRAAMAAHEQKGSGA